eukprot:Phypoly_transcript_15806.p1 GENE.Phypoly_transcript_15806~~Phypoly_transcript_15806.p1  ORF type:complete len:275 (+),score=30.70 Phypoly_transcript_15806:29-826(+)
MAEINLEELICTTASAHLYKGSWNCSPVMAKIPLASTLLKEDDFLTFKVELMTLSKLNHPNIIKFYGGSLDRSQICIVMEYLQNGNLRDLLLKKSSFSYFAKLQLLHDIAAGLAYLHSQSVIHRDLKPTSLMMDQNNHIKISNFGVSKLKEAAKTTVYHGEVVWTAPELLLNKSYNEKVDIFSFGMVMYELYTLHPPFATLDAIQAALNVIKNVHPQIPNDCPAQYRNLMESCWQTADARPSSDQLLVSLEAMMRSEKPALSKTA